MIVNTSFIHILVVQGPAMAQPTGSMPVVLTRPFLVNFTLEVKPVERRGGSYTLDFGFKKIGTRSLFTQIVLGSGPGGF